MYTPLVIPLPLFFIFLLIKIITMLAAPFALGVIVRIRYQAAEKKKVKISQNSDKGTPPQPSSSSDGEDKPEDSYWTRFKKWCSDHSLALGLGIAAIAATVIYIYREDISQFIYDQKKPDGKEEETEKEEGLFPTLAQESSLNESQESPATTFGDYYCLFVEKEPELTFEKFFDSKLRASKVFEEIQEFYLQNPDKNPEAERLLKSLLEIVPNIADSAQFLGEELKKDFFKSSEERPDSVKIFIKFITQEEGSFEADALRELWVKLVNHYFEDFV